MLKGSIGRYARSVPRALPPSSGRTRTSSRRSSPMSSHGTALGTKPWSTSPSIRSIAEPREGPEVRIHLPPAESLVRTAVQRAPECWPVSARVGNVRNNERRVKTPVTIAPEALDFTRLIRAGETVGWPEATAEPVFLTRLLDAQAERCPPFRVFFALTFSDGFAPTSPSPHWAAPAPDAVFAPAAPTTSNISDISGFVSSGRLPIDVVLLQVSGPDETGRY